MQINTQYLDNFLLRMEQGYSKHGNPYHNLTHAADVTQTTHAIINESGLSVSKMLVILPIFYILHRKSKYENYVILRSYEKLVLFG